MKCHTHITWKKFIVFFNELIAMMKRTLRQKREKNCGPPLALCVCYTQNYEGDVRSTQNLASKNSRPRRDATHPQQVSRKTPQNERDVCHMSVITLIIKS